MFADRRDAGHQLMDLVKQYSHEIDLVLAIPKGGVEVGAAIAQDLHRPLKLISARKIGAPHNPEIAIGAVTPDGSAWYNEPLLSHYKLSSEEVSSLSNRAASEQEKLRKTFGGEVDLDSVAGKGVLVVDDGAATGATLLACVEALGKAGAHPIGAAVPVASIDVVSVMEDRTDFFLAVETPSDFLAVSQYYHEFGDVSAAKTRELLGNQ